MRLCGLHLGCLLSGDGMVFQQGVQYSSSLYTLNATVLFVRYADCLQPLSLGEFWSVNTSENGDFKPPKLYAG